MAWMKKDRLTAVSALRRVRAPAATEPLPNDFRESRERLAEMLGATIERNHYGEFLRVRRWLPEPEPCDRPHALGRVLRPPPVASDLADPGRWLFLDTETTGLAGGTGTCAFLVGLAWWERGGLTIEQLFLRDYDEEHAVLLALAERMEERRVLVTYNGKSFDWPLLETRFRLTRQIEPESPRAHMDLLHPARQLWRLQHGTARLSEIERLVLGIERGPDILSALIPQMYFEYLRGGSPEPLVPVFHHNQGDLAGLAALARHMARLVEAPEQAEPLEQYGLSRLLERGGDRTRARRVYEMAIEAGLPRLLGLTARRRLAKLARRDGELGVAHSLWQELASLDSSHPERKPSTAHRGEGSRAFQGSTTLRALRREIDPAEHKQTLETILEACEQLAIHYEHRERNRDEAIRWTRHAAQLLRDADGLDRRFRHRWTTRLARRLTRLEAHRNGPGEVLTQV